MEAEKTNPSRAYSERKTASSASGSRFKAVFRKGVLVPKNPLELDEGAEVELCLETAAVLVPPPVTDPEERRRILKEVVKRMLENPIPEGAPRFTRDDLHERS